jgi:hypothetical protein
LVTTTSKLTYRRPASLPGLTTTADDNTLTQIAPSPRLLLLPPLLSPVTFSPSAPASLARPPAFCYRYWRHGTRVVHRAVHYCTSRDHTLRRANVGGGHSVRAGAYAHSLNWLRVQLQLNFAGPPGKIDHICLVVVIFAYITG